MRHGLPEALHEAVARLRGEPELPANTADLFEAVLEVVEYIASRDEAVRVRELEPDALARRLLLDPEASAFAAVNEILEGFSDRDVARLEHALGRLERRHGAVLETPPGHRLLVDGAVLGQIGFAYNRKHQEVLATRSLADLAPEPGLLLELTTRVDGLFRSGRPRYLWRLGPEFGVYRNVALLLDRGDDFIIGSLFRSRAERLARGVLRWQVQPDGCRVGENCDGLRYRTPVRHLVVRQGPEGSETYRLLLTNLVNMPWEDVYRLYRNRSGKLASQVEITRGRSSWRHRIAVCVVILALFTFRTFRTWAFDSQVYKETIVVDSERDLRRNVSLFESRQLQDAMSRMALYLDYLQTMTGGTAKLEGLTGELESLDYRVGLEAGFEVPVMEPGQVYFIDREGRDGRGQSVVVYHGGGFSTLYGNLASIAEHLRVGSAVSAKESLGTAADGRVAPLHLQGRLAKRYFEKGFEPTAADVLSEQANMVLDPVALLVELDSLAGEEQPPEQEIPTVPDLGESEIFTLSGQGLASEILFLAPSLQDEPADEPIVAELFDEDLGGARVLGEDVS